jgi:lipopolysaccharide/colanic/teichoic acid biosynthesis glycosyltransferase
VTLIDIARNDSAARRGTTPLGLVRPYHRAKPGYALKWPFEATLAFIGLILLLPLSLVIALAIWLDDRGSIFIQQTRVGRGGAPIRVFKFRTMHPVVHIDTERQATVTDNRVTRVGQLLRATALDEIPQLLNVIRGEMSLVGPRALLPEEIEVDPRSHYRRIEDVPGYNVRISVRQGLTGVAQVYAPRVISRQRKFRYDALYVRRMSLWLDIRLIVVSIFCSLTGRWPERGRHEWHRRNGDPRRSG